MTSARKAYFVARAAVLLLAANSVATTNAWTTTSPATMGRIRAKIRSCRSSSSFVQMSSSGSEGGSSSYEEQYAAFAKQHQTQKELQDPQQPLAQANQIGGDEVIPNPSVTPSTNSMDPIRKENESRSFATPIADSKRDGDRKAQEELETAFLDFISCASYESKFTPSMDASGSEQQENLQHNLYADVSNPLTDDGTPTFATFVDAASKGPSSSASTSYLDNKGKVSTSHDESSDVADSADVFDSDSDTDTDSDSDSDSDDNCYTIEVRVETTFPTGITVEDAKRGWLEFCWAKGGGIVVPAAVSAKPPSAYNTNSTEADHAPDTIKFGTEEQTNNKGVQDHESGSSRNIEGELPTGIPSFRELIVPLGMKQRLVSSTSILDEIQTNTIRRDVLTYKSTDTGCFCKDMIENTHEGSVEFIGALYTSTRMIWTVKFQVEQEEETVTMPTTVASNQDTTNVMDFASTTKTRVETMMSKANLWGSWSQFQLKTASQNLIAYMDNSADSMPVLEHTETLPVGVSPREAMEAWYAYYWKNGGGAIPIISSRKKGSEIRWIIPTGLEEELVSLEYDRPVSESGVVGVDGEITTETEIAKAVYKVNNPNLLTYPVYYNRATVRFVRDGEETPTQLVWKVQVKPYRKFLGGGVLFGTKNGIALAARNLRKYLELRQLEREERELQAQLKQLRRQNPASSTTSSTASSSSSNGSDLKTDDDDDAEKDDQMLYQGFKTIRSTLSISSAQAALAIDEKKEPASTGDNDNDNDNGDSDNNSVSAVNGDRRSLRKNPEVKRPASPGVVVDEKTPASTVKPEDKEDLGTRSMFIPDLTIERPTMVIDTHTHEVKDEGKGKLWP